MKTIGKLLTAAAIAMVALSSTTSVAVARIPWYEWTGYYTNGVLTGDVRLYCDGRIRESGNVIVYDESVTEHYYDCP